MGLGRGHGNGWLSSKQNQSVVIAQSLIFKGQGRFYSPCALQVVFRLLEEHVPNHLPWGRVWHMAYHTLYIVWGLSLSLSFSHSLSLSLSLSLSYAITVSTDTKSCKQDHCCFPTYHRTTDMEWHFSLSPIFSISDLYSLCSNSSI
jgi:hypothetical protein